MKVLLSVALSIALVGSFACSKSEKAGSEKASADKAGTKSANASYTVRAMVKGKAASSVMLHHEAIPDFVNASGEKAPMMSMSMKFGLKDATIAAEVKPGDKVSVTFEVDWNKKPAVIANKFEKLPEETELDLGGH
jgi:Cu/Ag efflux protein CusF